MAINFESSWEKEKAKKQVKEQRDWILEEAKRDFEHRQWKKEQAEKRGEGTWMLPELEESLSKKSSKKKKKEKKSKKKKKDKKKKKKKRKDSSSSSDSDSDSEEEQWVEKKAEDEGEAKVKGPQLERDSWMMDSAMESLFGGESQAEKRAKRDKEKEEKAKLAAMIEEPGQHKLELNPYWRDGGAGLPAEVAAQKPENPVLGGVATYGAVEWLKKALKRCEDQAKEEGRSVEEIAAERHGSLEELKERLRKTEEAYRQSLRREPATSRGGFQRRFKRPGEEDDERDNRRRFKRPGEEDDEGDSRRRFKRPDEDSDRRDRRSRSRERRRSRSRDRRSRSRERRRSRSRDRSGSRDRKPQRDRRSRSRDRSPDRERRRRSRERSRSRDRDRRRSRSRERRSRSRDRSDFSSRLKGRFRRPGEEGERAYARPAASAPAWKKPGFQKPGEEKAAERKLSPPKKQERKKSPSPSSSSSSSSSEEESSESEEEPVRELSEQEKNELGAKIMRAELMGNEALAAKLKAELNAAQNPKPPKASKPKKKKPSKEDDDDDDDSKVVLLTQTTRKGIVRPMGEEGNAVDGGGVGKSRRKKRKMATHDKDGQRERYFADDDRHDLKSMVHAEKMGTAEDSNMMFARLAGRSMEKTDDDHQLDDVMLQRATKANKTIEDERARAKAIMEHRKTSKCMERCRYCFDNVAKHLIVAIGSKCYLALPQHVSLTEGHCLVVPMQHVASGTAMDEDVWMEIQTFRKLLTKMFRERDEDVMFMETSSSMDGHMVLECVPVPIEIGDMAPIYFKKAIDECEGMWADNKKLVNLSNKDVRAAVPKGFPYFAVDFGLQGGYAHVLEDARTFPAYFGREIVGGMLDVEPTLWRKPRKENFDDARKKVLQFASMWKPYDWTKKNKDLSDSD